MHPAFSVIVFTTLSGAGYGLMFWLGLYAIAGLLPGNSLFGAATMVVTLGAVTVGLLSSTLHLGRPERAWRAFSQWRSSWLSREGVASTLTYIPALIFGAGWVFLDKTDGLWALSGLVASACAVVTVICTAYIYRSLKPIPRWHNKWVVPNYLTLSAMSGVLLLTTISGLFGYAMPGAVVVTLIAIVIAFLTKFAYWRFIDSDVPTSTPETATGLGALGKVRLFEAPHTSENYLLKEMGYRVARKHARKLRMIAILFGFVAPFALMAIAFFAPGAIAVFCALLATIVALTGILVERWLFFAEAKHAVTLFYGRSLDAA